MTSEEVWREVERFRAKHLTGDIGYLPVDVFTLVELDLQLNPIPFPNLFNKYDVDAAILPDFSGIYIDEESYLNWGQGPKWKENRLRFSVSHELGHFWLHRDIPAQRSSSTFEEWAAWTRTNEGQKYWIEQDANEFAGRLLVPLERLREEYDKFFETLSARYPDWHPGNFRGAFAETIAPKFGVNFQVIDVRLDREGLWPAT